MIWGYPYFRKPPMIQAVLPLLQSAGTALRARGALGPHRNSVTLMTGPAAANFLDVPWKHHLNSAIWLQEQQGFYFCELDVLQLLACV